MNAITQYGEDLIQHEALYTSLLLAILEINICTVCYSIIYSPGAIVEVCNTLLTLYFSYYHVILTESCSELVLPKNCLKVDILNF